MEGLNGRLERHDLYNKTENVPVSPQGGTGIFCARIENRFHRAEKKSAHWRGGGWNSRRWAVWSPLFYGGGGEKRGNSLFLKRWDSGVGRIFWGGGRWESGLMGKPLYGSREGKRAGGARRGWNSRRWAGVVSPVLRRGEKRGTASIQKGGKCFCRGRKKWNDPLPAGRESC